MVVQCGNTLLEECRDAAVVFLFICLFLFLDFLNMPTYNTFILGENSSIGMDAFNSTKHHVQSHIECWHNKNTL